MANILYSYTNNSCANSNNGSIHINQINFDNDNEARLFSSHTIQWSGLSLNPSQISSDHRSIENLYSGLYSFSLYSLADSSIIGPYNIEISSPDALSIINCEYSSSSCNNKDGSVNVSISGGVPPYSVFCGIYKETSINNNISLSGINSGEYTLKVSDNNGCLIIYDKKIKIDNKTLSAQILEIVSPTLLDNYGIIKFKINGEGLFKLEFINNDTKEITCIDYSFSSKYITQKIDNKYYYTIYDKIVPGSYSLKITNESGCSFITKFVMKNIEPMAVECYPERIYQPMPYSQHLTQPILDTLLIPFHHIKNNTTLWQFVKNLQLKDKIDIKINNNIIQYAIVRNILDKDDTEKVEVLRLGPDPTHWFFYFYIAPGINLKEKNDLISDYKLVIKNKEEYSLKIGSLDTKNPSIIKGSFILQEVGLNQFCNIDNNVYINLGKNNKFDDYTYSLSSSFKQTFKTLYDLGYSTIISFLDDKKLLISKVNISDTSCFITEDEYKYLLNINEMINYINNINNIFDIHIYNTNTSHYFNNLRINIKGNEIFALENKEKVQNEYNISYLLFNEFSIEPEIIDKKNKIHKGVLLDNIRDGYIIIKLQDLYNNKTKVVSYNNLSINYDTHFTEASTLIKKINNNIISYFNYGDILIYIGTKDTPINIPHNINRKI